MENIRYLKNKKIMLYLKLTFCLGNLLTFSLSNNSQEIVVAVSLNYKFLLKIEKLLKFLNYFWGLPILKNNQAFLPAFGNLKSA